MPKKGMERKKSSEDAPFVEDREATMDMMRGDEEFMEDLKDRHDIEEIFTTNYDEVQKLYERYQKRMAKEGRMTKERAEFLIHGDEEYAGAAQELKRFYTNEKNRLGMEVGLKDTDGIEEYMEMLAKKNPRELEKTANKIQIYQKRSEALEQLRQKFRDAGESAKIPDMARKLEEEYEAAQQTVRRPQWMAKSGLRAEAFTPQAIVARRRIMKTYNYKVDRLPDVVKSLRALEDVRRDLILDGIFVNTLVERSNQKANDELAKVFQPEEKIYEADEIGAVEIDEAPAPIVASAKSVFGTTNLRTSGSARRVFGSTNLGTSESAIQQQESARLEQKPKESMEDAVQDEILGAGTKPEQAPQKISPEAIAKSSEMPPEEKDEDVKKFILEMQNIAIEAAFGSRDSVDTIISSVDDADSARRLLLVFNELEDEYSQEGRAMQGKAGEMYISLQQSLIRTSFRVIRDRLQEKLWEMEDNSKLKKKSKNPFNRSRLVSSRGVRSSKVA